MKVFFDTNVYVAEALLGDAAVRMLEATVEAKWRIHICSQVLDEIETVLVKELKFAQRLASLTRLRAARRAVLTAPGSSRHHVPSDPKDNPILQAAIAAGVDISCDQRSAFAEPASLRRNSNFWLSAIRVENKPISRNALASGSFFSETGR